MTKGGFSMPKGTKDEQRRLTEVFNKVSDPSDWKKPIDSLFDPREVTKGEIEEAIIYFTGTIPVFTYINSTTMRVSAIGYRMGPAGP